tara:strand:+ start:750 stop:1202 length:453 start_codon:yes stop_codon:yes gene_type:complete
MKINILLILVATLIISSCSTGSLRPDVVDRSATQRTQSVTFGVIEDVTKVTVEGDRELGAAAGAAIGAEMGSDNNKAPFAAGVIGALIGSKVGAEIGSATTKVEGVELLILLDNGKYISIIQEASDIYFLAGDKVKIIRSGGKSRVLPRR